MKKLTGQEKQEKIKKIEDMTGLSFKDAQTGSFYANYSLENGDYIRIRLSNHFSKFTERKDYDIRLDIDLNDDIDYILTQIQLRQYTPKYKKGDIVEHRRLGGMEFISYNKENDSYKVLYNGEQKEYFRKVFI